MRSEKERGSRPHKPLENAGQAHASACSRADRFTYSEDEALAVFGSAISNAQGRKPDDREGAPCNRFHGVEPNRHDVEGGS